MHIGLVGLGRMGGNMRERLRRGGHEVTGYDRDAQVSDAGSLSEVVEALPSPKVVWVMVPSGDPTNATIDELAGLLDEGDVIVDGGNSRWTDDQKHAAALAEHGIGFVDCGVDNVPEVLASWREGTVIRSWLLDLLVDALKSDEGLSKIAGWADDSGEGRWTLEAAIDHAVPLNAIAASLFARFGSRQEESPAMKAVAAMRQQFGGHPVHAGPSGDTSSG